MFDQQAYYKTHRSRWQEYGRAWRKDNPEKFLLSITKCRAKKAGLPFNLELSDISIPDRCPILGIPLFRGNKPGPHNNSPSIDKIIPRLGYVKGNVRIISWRANELKSDATAIELMLVAEDLYEIESKVPSN